MEVAIPVFDRVTALDAVGPYEVLSRLPGARVSFVAAETGEVRTDTRQLGLVADRALADVGAPEVVVVPGGAGTRDGSADAVVAWLRAVAPGARWTTSVCTGSLLLADAGLLDGVEAATHWLYRDALRSRGALPVRERVVRRGSIVTAAGVSAGLDMALALAALEAGEATAQAIQLAIEYDPRPPFDAGSPESAPPSVVAAVRDGARRAGEVP